MVADRQNRYAASLKSPEHVVRNHRTLIDANQLVAPIQVEAVLPPQKLLGLRVNDRTEEKLVVRRAERWATALGERGIEEVTPLPTRCLAVGWALTRRDASATGHQF